MAIEKINPVLSDPPEPLDEEIAGAERCEVCKQQGISDFRCRRFVIDGVELGRELFEPKLIFFNNVVYYSEEGIKNCRVLEYFRKKKGSVTVRKGVVSAEKLIH